MFAADTFLYTMQYSALCLIYWDWTRILVEFVCLNCFTHCAYPFYFFNSLFTLWIIQCTVFWPIAVFEFATPSLHSQALYHILLGQFNVRKILLLLFSTGCGVILQPDLFLKQKVWEISKNKLYMVKKG